jgi:hypothetical protein
MINTGQFFVKKEIVFKIAVSLLCVLSSMHCREHYDLPTSGLPVSPLVVEGFINYHGPTSIRLSRPTRINDRRILPEEHAIVNVEGENNTIYPLLEKDSGRYEADDIPLNVSTRYKLSITTADNRQYTSTFESVILTPPIDSLPGRERTECR